MEKVKEFTFDHSYWSADRRSRNYTNQEMVGLVAFSFRQ